MTDMKIGNLTLDEKIGQLLAFGFDQTTLNGHALRMIRDNRIGNVILFARNVRDPEQLFKLNQALQNLAMETIHIPLFIMIDQEGGMVTRLKNGVTFFPGAMTIGASQEPVNSYQTGRLMGRELKALGINMDLAPVLDINNNPLNPVIGVRSYGDDPELVRTRGCEMIRGLQESVIATAKHFPGHGDTLVDSHLDLPKIDKSLDALEKLELVPFKAAIGAGVKAIMSAHIDFPALTDNGLPTTLSHRMLTGYLRNKLGFKGLIITDCMEMKAIQSFYTTKKGALMALKAGADLILVSHSEELQEQTAAYIKEAVLNNEFSMSELDQRVQRVLSFKQENIVYDPKTAFADVKAQVGDRAAKDFALGVVRDAFTLVRGKPFADRGKTLLLASNPLSTTIADETHGEADIVEAIRKQLPQIDTMRVSVKLDEAELSEIINKAKDYQQVVFCSYNANLHPLQQQLIRALNRSSELHVIAMRNPYDLVFVDDIENLSLAYEYTPNSVQVLVEYLSGNLVPRGKPPVRL